ncbi:GNAT family N-acetyltransferase [Streptomyces griseoflavus]|uniref:GNAT family N-acetyltransferase n=1 Tax=Streptomyces griseoflavus TaxID=35619 RepID=UPI003D744771
MTAYESELLRDHHQFDVFDCGKAELNDWLTDSARHCNRNNTARTFVWTEPGDSNVLAYYSLAAHLVEKNSVPPRLGRGSPEQCPVVLLARLALDKTLHGQRLGGVLLADALDQVVRAVQNVAARFLIVDAIDEEAATFYERYGFKRIPGDSRLFRKMSDIVAALEY